MNAAVTAAMPPLPTYPLQECIKVSGMYTSGSTWFMGSKQLVTIEGILLFCPNEAQDLMKICNGRKITPDQ